MITRSEQEVLTEIFKSSRAALFDIHSLLGKVYDEELALDLNLQAARYSRLEEKAADGLLEKGLMPNTAGLKEKSKQWAKLQMQTAFNISTPHVAEVLIEKKEDRSRQVNEVVRKNQAVHEMVYELAEEFVNFEEDSIRILKDYLRI